MLSDTILLERSRLVTGGVSILSPCELVNQNPQQGFRCPSEITEGLMQTRTADDGSYVMEWYAPAAVTALNNGEYQTSGSPFIKLDLVNWT